MRSIINQRNQGTIAPDKLKTITGSVILVWAALAGTALAGDLEMLKDQHFKKGFLSYKWITYQGDVQYDPPAAVVVPQPTRLSGAIDNPSGNLRLHIDAQDNSPYAIQVSANLTAWSSVHTNQPGGNLDFLDSPAAQFVPRFYRTLALTAPPPPPLAAPAWKLTQNGDCPTVDSVAPTILGDGSFQWAITNRDKKFLILGPPDGTNADVVMHLDSDNYWSHIFRTNKPAPICSYWIQSGPNSLFTSYPIVGTLTELNWYQDMLMSDEYHNHGNDAKGKPWNGNKCTHFSKFINIAHKNNNADNFCIGLMTFNDIWTTPPGDWVSWNGDMGKMDYQIGPAHFTGSLQAVGTWKTWRGDLLTHIKKAIDYGYAHSYITSGNYSDYELQYIQEDGFEMTGLNRCTMQLKNMSLNTSTGPGRRFVAPKASAMDTTNHYDGWAGMSFTVDADPLVITGLGRWVMPGNSATHNMMLVNASTKQQVVGSGCTVTTLGATASKFAYANLATPIRLAPNTEYYVLSLEGNVSDTFFGGGTQIRRAFTYPRAAASPNGWMTCSLGGAWTGPSGGANACYGPVDFRYGKPMAFSQSLGTTLTDSTSWRGCKLTVKGDPITVTALGRWVLSGNTQSHIVHIVNAVSPYTELAQATVATSGATAGAFTYVTLAAPITLMANTSYYLASEETSGGDYWCQGSTTTVTPSPCVTINGTAANYSGTWTSGSTANQCIGPVSFLYTSPQ